MTTSPIRLGLIFGGRSVEHEVSVVSAQHVIAAADSARFEVVPIGVTKDGVWLGPEATLDQLARNDPPFKKTLIAPSPSTSPSPSTERGPGGEVLSSGGGTSSLSAALQSLVNVDVVFPLIHGTHGEDGTLQGLLELAGLPYVGCGVAASALGMDKALMKAVFADAGIPITEHEVVLARDCLNDPLGVARDIEERLGFPTFVKPANGGSSLGISKVRNREELTTALTEAGKLDRKLVFERFVAGREVECGVLGNDDAIASPVGMIEHQRDFYDYEAKYLDPRSKIFAPADLPADVVERVQALSLRAFKAIDGAGMSRVDFFLRDDGSLMIDEINTIPGFTPASMFPRLWQAAGVGYSELITRLVDYAMTRNRERPIA